MLPILFNNFATALTYVDTQWRDLYFFIEYSFFWDEKNWLLHVRKHFLWGVLFIFNWSAKVKQTPVKTVNENRLVKHDSFLAEKFT